MGNQSKPFSVNLFGLFSEKKLLRKKIS